MAGGTNFRLSKYDSNYQHRSVKDPVTVIWCNDFIILSFNADFLSVKLSDGTRLCFFPPHQKNSPIHFLFMKADGMAAFTPRCH